MVQNQFLDFFTKIADFQDVSLYFDIDYFLNLFLRDSCYNRFLCKKYGLFQAEEWMEIPLDSLTAASLKRRGARGNLPQWPGLSRLTPGVSE